MQGQGTEYGQYHQRVRQYCSCLCVLQKEKNNKGSSWRGSLDLKTTGE